MVIVVVLLIVIGGLYFLWQSQNQKQMKLDTFAECITQSGAQFYGAFWCPHCQEQKAEFDTIFGTGADKLPYIECSTPDTNDQLKVCADAGIKGYPTWKFADGSVKEGALSLQQLSTQTGCALPN